MCETTNLKQKKDNLHQISFKLVKTNWKHLKYSTFCEFMGLDFSQKKKATIKFKWVSTQR